MPVNLFLSKSPSGISNYWLLEDVGVALSDVITNTAASGTEIQITDVAGGTTVAWISRRIAAAITITSMDVLVYAFESNMAANVGGRARIFKRAPGGTETELGGGPFDDGVEFGTGFALMSWTCNVTDTAFAENDRILLKLYLTNIGTMAGGYTATIDNGNPNRVDILETVTFKRDSLTPQSPFAMMNNFLVR